MKKVVFILAVLLGVSVTLQAQKPVIEKPRVEAKKLSKEGYRILPEGLYPMKRQLEFVYNSQMMKDEDDGSTKYIIGIGIASDASLNQAVVSASGKAVQEILGQVLPSMKSIIEKNGGIKEKGSVSVDELLRTVEDKCKQKMSSVPTLAIFYKKENGRYVVRRYCTYSYKDARTMAIDFFEAELKNESEQLRSALRKPSNLEIKTDDLL